MYEVVWARQLVLVFGNTTQAVSAILTGFFGGMAIGSGFGGRLGDRVARPLRLYGILELILVAVVLATPLTFRLIHEVYRGAFGSLQGSPGLLDLVRFGLSLLALGPATILMGVTLPALTRYLARDPAHLTQAFGRLYAANTIGAILGTVAAGFVLIELLGLTGTLIAGAACSGIAGIVALVLDRSRGRAPLAPPAVDATGQAAEPSSHPRFRLALIVAFISGLTSLGYQVLWTRLFASGTGGSTYVFTAILAVFLIGLAAGALVFSMVRKRIHDTVSFLAQGQLAIALLVLAPVVVSIHLPSNTLLDLPSRFQNLFSDFLLPVAAAVLPATFVMGLTFPATAALVEDPQGRIATNTGLLLSANTVGAIVGTFVLPFFVIPVVGSSRAVALFGLANLAVALALATGGGIRSARDRRSVSLLSGALAVVIAAALVFGGVFVDPNERRIARAGGRVFESREDRIASVQAGELPLKRLWVSGTSMTALTVDAKLMPILPLILRPEAQTALAVAFGMGSSHRTALNAGLRADVVELVPSVPAMFHWFYSDAEQVLANPAGRVIISDGRNHVELTDAIYDIIVTDPPPPIESAGVSVISSREYYAASKARLSPGGVMMQWVPYGPRLDEFKAHVRTYHAVFPHVIVAVGPGANGFFMLGSDQPIAFDTSSIRSVLSRPGIVEDLASAFDSPEHTLEGWVRRIPALIWMEGSEVGAFAGAGPLITDDRPLPEYFLFRHLLVTSPRLMPGTNLSALVPGDG